MYMRLVFSSIAQALVCSGSTVVMLVVQTVICWRLEALPELATPQSKEYPVVLQNPKSFELAWRLAWYEEINFWRSTVAGLLGLDKQLVDHSFLTQAATQLQAVCLHGVAFYKVLACHVQRRYGTVDAADIVLDDSLTARLDKEYAENVAGLPDVCVADCAPLVHMCVLKMGDLAR